MAGISPRLCGFERRIVTQIVATHQTEAQGVMGSGSVNMSRDRLNPGKSHAATLSGPWARTQWNGRSWVPLPTTCPNPVPKKGRARDYQHRSQSRRDIPQSSLQLRGLLGLLTDNHLATLGKMVPCLKGVTA